MKQSPQAAARRHARALLEVSVRSGDPDRVAGELSQLADAIDKNPELRAALNHPALDAERRRRLVAALFPAGSQLLLGLLALLGERGELHLLPPLSAAFRHAWNERRGVKGAEVVSAVPLDDAQRAALVGAIERASGAKVELRARVDPALLGGLLVNLGGTTFDGSVRAQLEGLRKRLTRGAAA